MDGTGSVFEQIAVDELKLDSRNPRIAKYIEMYGDEISADDMSLALGAGDSQTGEGGTTFASLRESIRTNGGVIHPIIVNKETAGRLIVIEGNTRTLIYRQFRDGKIQGNWSTIPAMVYSDLSDKEIDAIRLQAHLVGPRQWDPYSKAKYLDFLRNSKHLTFAQIVDFCGGRKREVADFIQAYNDMESYYRPLLESDDQFDASRFSAFVELQRTRVKQALLDTGFEKTDFARWVKEQLIYPLLEVRSLPRVLRNPKSREVFLKDGLREALKVLDTPSADDVLVGATLAQLAQEISRRVLNITYSELQELRSSVASYENEVLCDARNYLTQLCADIVSDE